MRYNKITTALPLIAFLFAIVQGVSAIAQQPASPAQLAAWQNQIVALQNQKASLQNQRAAVVAQQQAASADAQRMLAAREKAANEILLLKVQETVLDRVQKNPGLAWGLVTWASGKSEDQIKNTAAAMYLEVTNQITKLNNLSQVFAAVEEEHRTAAVTAKQKIAQIDAQIEQIDAQIAQLERTIAYYRNPLQGDLENEQARLKNLEGQKPTQDDGGQLGRDIENTRKRITEIEALQRQFQDGGGSSSGASTGTSSGQPQGSYGAPAAGISGTGPQSQLPAGYDPYLGAAGIVAPGSSMPTHQGLRGRFPPQTTGGSTHSGPSGTATTTTGTKQPTTGSSTAGAQPPVRPPSGATCGPATSCMCAGGGRGHIPCDADKGPCHCGGG